MSSRMQVVVVTVAASVVAFGCSKEAPENHLAAPAASAAPVVASGAVTGTAAVASAAVAPTVSASAEPVPAHGLFADKLPEGLPPHDPTPLDVDTMKKSTDVDTQAGKARDGKSYGKAKELYVEALKADPGNVPARYNLARTLILDGQHDAGLGVLDQLYRAESCYVCRGLLLKAAQEKDFGAVVARAEFKERTEGVGKELPTFEHAAKQVLTWLGKPTLEDMPPLVDHRTFIVLERPSAGFKMFKGAKAFIEYVVDGEKTNFPEGRKWGGTVGPPMGMSYKCANECCEISTYDPPGKRNVLERMCFKAQGNVATALYKLKVSD